MEENKNKSWRIWGSKSSGERLIAWTSMVEVKEEKMAFVEIIWR